MSAAGIQFTSLVQLLVACHFVGSAGGVNVPMSGRIFSHAEHHNGLLDHQGCPDKVATCFTARGTYRSGEVLTG